MTEPVLNAHNKEEYPPAHTAEHILNATMVKMAGGESGGRYYETEKETEETPHH